jgi:4a-hydroxytetrahydrobiopterin dehydratase
MEKFTDKQIQDYLSQLDGWEYVDGAIETTFEFKDFKEAFSVMTRIAFECEAQGHHPDWSNVYKTVNIRLNTHDANGVTEKDFELAGVINALVS